MSIMSVRNLTVFLVLICIVLTAGICTGIAVASGDVALDATKESCSNSIQATRTSSARALTDTQVAYDDGLGKCFSSATQAITARNNEMLINTAFGVKNQLLGTFTGLQRSINAWLEVVQNTKPLSLTEDYDWLLAQAGPRLLADQRQTKTSGVSSNNIFTFSGKTVQITESSVTAPNPADGYHHDIMITCPGPRNACVLGTIYEGAKFNTTVDPVWDVRLPDGSGRYESDSCTFGAISPVTGETCELRGKRGCRFGRAPITEGAIDDGVCSLENWVPAEASITILHKSLFPVGKARWTHIVNQGPFMLAAASAVWGYSPTQKIGYLTSALNLVALKNYLKSIKVSGEGSITRIFLTVEWNWLYRTVPISTFDQKGALVAVSHGNETIPVYEFVPEIAEMSYTRATRPDIDATDPLIRGTTRHIQTHGGYEKFLGKVELFAMNNTLTSGGWIERVPGPATGDSTLYGPPENVTVQYINGHETEDSFNEAPLPGFVDDGTAFFMVVSDIAVGEGGLDGLWWLTMIIDWEYVLGETYRKQVATAEQINNTLTTVRSNIDADRRAVEQLIKESEEKVQSDLDRDRIVLYCVVAGTAIILMIISIVFVGRIVAPLLDLQYDMSEVAEMKLENVDEDRPLSALSEVNAMEASFKQMIKNLREFRSYMPASVLVDQDDDEEEEEDNQSQSAKSSEHGTRPSIDSKKTAESGAGTASRRSTQADKSLVSKRRRKSMASVRDDMSQRVQKAKAALGMQLAKKKASFLSGNIADFTKTAVGRSPQAVLDFIKVYIETWVNLVTKAKGVPDGFSGDRFYASFGAVRNCGTNRSVCANIALDGTIACAAALEVEEWTVQAGVSGGDVVCGNAGTDTMRKFCSMGTPATACHVACGSNTKWKSSVIIDQTCVAECKQTLNIRRLIPVPFKVGKLQVHQIVGKKKVEEDEWMYQLEQGEKDDPCKGFNEAIDAYELGDIARAVELLNKDKEANPSPQHDIAIALMDQADTKGPTVLEVLAVSETKV
eukprot:Hpha_TRINITY_DN15960_c4_g1::TRINITY_DN15960_c4_g1_i1::g.71013::m.71013